MINCNKSFIRFLYKQNIDLFNVKLYLPQVRKCFFSKNEKPYYHRTVNNFHQRNLGILCQQRRCISLFSPNLDKKHTYTDGYGGRIFWEPHKKGQYKEYSDKTNLQYAKEGFFEIIPEIRKWREEVKNKFRDPVFVRPGDTDIIFDFQAKEKFDDQWMIISDRDHKEGNSIASLTKSQGGHALFSGVIDKTCVQDGERKFSGYANMQTSQMRKSFKREAYFNWFSYTHLVMRIRGDGRRYLLVLNTAGTLDVSWFDIYSYILYTRGGPYWQDVKIPFSKFFLTTKGRVQDKQQAINLARVNNFGITAADKVSAPFRLEIDYIGVHCDPSHNEKFAYEMYRIPSFIVV